jgi:anaerobic magnesium-protoporphyrin IX monomethyl ester cyclase
MKLLLIHAGSGELELAEEVYLNAKAMLPPLGLLYLSSILEQDGHEPVVIDIPAEDNPIKEIRNHLPSSDAVGFSTYCHPYELKKSMELSRYIKEISPDIPMIIGGPHTSLLPELSLNEHNANIAITGRAENVISPVVDAIEGKRELSTIPGLYFRKGNKIIHNKVTENKKTSIDDIPFPARYLVDKYEYGRLLGVKLAEGKLTSLLSSEGCVFRCKFCNLRSHLPVFKSRSISNITNEIDLIVNQGYKTIVFVDDNFMVNKQRVEKIMDYIINKKYDIKIWIFGARADSVDENLWRKMKDAGVESMNFGVESGNQQILDYYNKKLTLDKTREAIKLCKKMGIFTEVNFIIGAPIETKESIQDTINFAKSLPADLAIFYLFTYTYKSEFWEEAVKKGLIKKDESRAVPDKNRGLGSLSTEEIMNYINDAYKSFYFNPSYLMRELIWLIRQNKYKYFKLGLRLLKSSKSYSGY